MICHQCYGKGFTWDNEFCYCSVGQAMSESALRHSDRNRDTFNEEISKWKICPNCLGKGKIRYAMCSKCGGVGRVPK